MHGMKKLIAAIVSILMIGTSFAGCQTEPEGNDSQPDDSGYQETITIAPSLDFTGMEVQSNSGGTSKSVYVLTFNTLIEKDTMNNELVPGLAISWEQVSDSSYEFKLREGVKFHDGTDFTAEDVKFTFERGKTQSSSKGKLSSIAGVEIVDDYTVRIELDPIDCDIIYKLTDPNCSILSANAFNTMAEEEAYKIGTGPYQYHEWVQGDYVSLIRFDDYWGELPQTKEIVIRYIPEASSRLLALQTGEIDICIDPPSIDLHYVAEDPDMTLLQVNSSTLRIVLLNELVEPFNNALVRQAIAHAINREDFVSAVYEGNATACNNVMNPTNSFYTEVEGYPYDVEKAKSLLAQAGYADGFDTTIYSSSGTVQKAVAAVLQAQLSAIGIRAEIQSLETATFNSMIEPGGTCPIIIDGWGGFTIGPDNALRSFFHSEGTYNESNVKDPELDRMLDEALVTGDIEARTAMYHEIQEYCTNLAVMLPIAVEQINIGMKSTVEGYELPDGLLHHWRNVRIPNA